MTARRPKVPRAGRPTPSAEERPADGTPTAPRPRGATSSSGARVSHPGGPSHPVQPREVISAQRGPDSVRTVGRSPVRGHRVAVGGPTDAGPRTPTAPVTPSEARAAERSQLAGSIRRGRLGSKRAESVIEPAEEATPIPAKTFSGRLLVLAVILVTAIVLLAPTVSRYVQQEQELDALRAEIAQQQEDQAGYRSDLARWDDPAFVRQQARERIFLVMPGETRYLVKGGDGIESGAAEGSSAAGPQDLPWVDSLWDSVVRAATD